MKFKVYLDESPLFHLIGIQKSLDKGLSKALKDSGLSIKEGLILLTLLFEKDSLGPSELIDALHFSKAQISQGLSKLESMGLIKRALNHQDARKTCILLTNLGAKKANALTKAYEYIDSTIEDKLGKEDLSAFLGNLKKLKN